MTVIDELADRIAELQALAEQEGLTLPMLPAVIALHELRGNVVDLRTGEILVNGAAVRVGIGPALTATVQEGQP